MSRWIAVDWTGRSPRAWCVEQGVPRMIAPLNGGPAPTGDPESVLLHLIETHLSSDNVTPVICCGTAAGWNSAAPRPVPARLPLAEDAAPVECRDTRLEVSFIPGLSQSDPADLMMGEETRIAGFIAAHPEWDGVLCLPGARSVWVHISAGEVVSFRSFMTGELGTLIATQSSLAQVFAAQGSWREDVFLTALGDAMSRPERVLGALSSMRVNMADAGSRLWGLLIGQELAAARAYWLGQQVALVGEGDTVAHYAAALAAQGVDAPTHDGGAMAIAGLIAVSGATQPLHS